MSTIKPDLGSKFQRFTFTEDDTIQALHVSPMFLAYLQNKKAVYAEALVEAQLPYDPDPSRQVAAILEHERLRNFCAAYEELINEIVDNSSDQQPSQES